jgi:hypothetical protein
MPVAACRAAAEWAGWICKKDGRAQRVQTALISRRYAENSNWTECRGNGDEEIAGNDPLGVQAQEGRPAQIASRPTSRTPGQVLAHRPGRHPNPDL